MSMRSWSLKKFQSPAVIMTFLYVDIFFFALTLSRFLLSYQKEGGYHGDNLHLSNALFVAEAAQGAFVLV